MEEEIQRIFSYLNNNNNIIKEEENFFLKKKKHVAEKNVVNGETDCIVLALYSVLLFVALALQSPLHFSQI